MSDRRHVDMVHRLDLVEAARALVDLMSEHEVDADDFARAMVAIARAAQPVAQALRGAS